MIAPARRWARFALVGVAVVLTGCGSGTSTSSADDRLRQATTVLGVDLQPPGSDPRPGVSRDEAVTTCRIDRPGICGESEGDRDRTTVLAVATAQGNDVDHRLAWVTTWKTECVGNGGIVAPGDTPAPRGPQACTGMVLVDATDGHVLLDMIGNG